VNIPTKPGWYRARWPPANTWTCVLVERRHDHLVVFHLGDTFDPKRIDEWGPSVDDTEDTIVSLRAEVEWLTAEVESLREACMHSGTIAFERTGERDDARRACAMAAAMSFERSAGLDDVRRYAIELYGADEAARLFPDGGSR